MLNSVVTFMLSEIKIKFNHFVIEENPTILAHHNY
jgi:hypothetical protein